MILFPAIDLIAGKVVRLERGDREHMKVYSDDPAAVARSFAEQGATWVHVVDLSAALEEDEGRARPIPVLSRRSARSRASRWISVAAFARLRASMNSRRSAASASRSVRFWCASRGLPRWQLVVRRPAGCRCCRARWRGEGERLARGRVAQRRRRGGRAFEPWIKHLVFTDIARDGMQTASMPKRTGAWLRSPGFPSWRREAVSSLDDIRALARGGSRGNRGRYHGAGAV